MGILIQSICVLKIMALQLLDYLFLNLAISSNVRIFSFIDFVCKGCSRISNVSASIMKRLLKLSLRKIIPMVNSSKDSKTNVCSPNICFLYDLHNWNLYTDRNVQIFKNQDKQKDVLQNKLGSAQLTNNLILQRSTIETKAHSMFPKY